jgi:hypothetical protein
MAVAVNAALKFLKYLTDTWMSESLWYGWSQGGCIHASQLLGIPIEGVIPTTNHLEAFNCVLKCKHIFHWQCAGKRLWFDLFIPLLITQIIAVIFNQRIQHQGYITWLSSHF